jgi:alkylation response protein AidB-like acyl-CoA dehydrogenase
VGAGRLVPERGLRRLGRGGGRHRRRTATWIQDECLRLIGPDPELERAVPDARLGPIGGGTDEIMREILGRSL